MARYYVVRLAKNAGLVLLFLLAAFLGTITGIVFAFAGDLPQISALDDYAPSTITRVYGARGEVVGEFSTERRVVVPYEAIAPKLRQAIISAEDAEFEQHIGLSIPHIVMAATCFPRFAARSPVIVRGRKGQARSRSSSRAGCSPRQSATRRATSASNGRSKRRSSRCRSRSV